MDDSVTTTMTQDTLDKAMPSYTDTEIAKGYRHHMAEYRRTGNRLYKNEAEMFHDAAKIRKISLKP